MASDRTYFLILGGAVLWCIAIVAAPLCIAEGGPVGFLGVVQYKFFHPICHQLDDRSFHILGKPLAVCVRCMAIYSGFLVGVLLYPCVGRRVRNGASQRAVLLLSVVPMLLDVLLDVIGIHQSTILTRCMSGGIFGLIVPYTIVPVAQEGVRELLATFHPFSSFDAKKGQSHA